jgi:hypothetical protein
VGGIILNAEGKRFCNELGRPGLIAIEGQKWNEMKLIAVDCSWLQLIAVDLRPWLCHRRDVEEQTSFQVSCACWACCSFLIFSSDILCTSRYSLRYFLSLDRAVRSVQALFEQGGLRWDHLALQALNSADMPMNSDISSEIIMGYHFQHGYLTRVDISFSTSRCCEIFDPVNKISYSHDTWILSGL